MVPGEIAELQYERQGKTHKAELTPAALEVMNPQRGLVFEPKSEKYVATAWSEAAFLGVRQTWEDAFRVVGVLKKLVTGQVPLANLGGIGSIAYVAGKETEQGISRLLVFLTMLSANLAVLNFLPIPALDGGHMMFLVYEGVFRKPVNERLQVALTIAGVACLLGLMIFVNAMDIHRFLF
jgi:regulator of sigma E protease